MNKYQTLNRFKHPKIIKAYGFCQGDDDNSPLFLLEICASNLQNEIKLLNDFDKITIIYEMMSVHKSNVIHRDLKPAKISDFGISCWINVKTQTKSSQNFMGTLKFMFQAEYFVVFIRPNILMSVC